MAAILDGFMRGYNFVDSIQARDADRKWQGEVRDRQRGEWNLQDQERQFADAGRGLQTILGGDTYEQAVQDATKKSKLIEWSNAHAGVFGIRKRPTGNAEVTDLVADGNGKVTPILKITDDKGNHVSTGPMTVDGSSKDDSVVQGIDEKDILGYLDQQVAALRSKYSPYNDYAMQQEGRAADIEMVQSLQSAAPSTQYEAQSTQDQGLGAAINGQPRTGMANEKFALSTVGSETVPASPYATGAQQTPIDGMDPAEQAKLNGYLDASVEANRGNAQNAQTAQAPKTPPPPAKSLADAQKEKDAQPDLVTRGVNAVLDGFKRGAGEESRHKAVIDNALDIKSARGDQVRRNPEKYRKHYAKVRDQYTPDQQAQLDELFNTSATAEQKKGLAEAVRKNELQQQRLQQRLDKPGFFYNEKQKDKFIADTKAELAQAKQERAALVSTKEETPTSGRVQRGTTDAVPSTKAEVKAKVDAVTDDKAKKVAEETRAPTNTRQVEGMQNQIGNIRANAQLTTKQKKALAQAYMRGNIDLTTYERAMRTGRLSKQELEQVKTDSMTYLVDKESGQTVRQFKNEPQTTVTDDTKAAAAGQKFLREQENQLWTVFERQAYGAGARKSEDAKRMAGRAVERVNGTPFLTELGIDKNSPAGQNFLWEANRLAQVDENAGRPNWLSSLFGAEGDRINDLTPYLLDQMRPRDNVPELAKLIASQKENGRPKYDREATGAILMQAARVAELEKKPMEQVLRELMTNGE